MKKPAALLFVFIITVLCLTGCKKDENISFTATIKKLYNGSSMLVSTTENVGFGSASVDISKAEISFPMAEGQTIRLTIEPLIRETSPVQVTAVSAELLEEAFLTGASVPGESSSDIYGVSMSIKPGSVTSKGLTAIIRDENEQTYVYGEWYQLLRSSGDRWEEVPVTIEGDYGFNEIGIMTDENGVLTLEVDWQWLYGELNAGSYRIVKALYFTDGYKYFSADFEIG